MGPARRQLPRPARRRPAGQTRRAAARGHRGARRPLQRAGPPRQPLNLTHRRQQRSPPRLAGTSTPNAADSCANSVAANTKSRDSFPRSRLRLEAGLEPAWSVSQTDCEVPARFAPGRNIQLCHKREHHRRLGATRTRIYGLGHRCPDPLDDEPWRRGGSRTRPAVLRTASRPASPAPCPRADSNGRPRGSEPRALSTAPRGHKVRREGLEPPCGMPDLQSGAVAAAPPTLGVTSQIELAASGITARRSAD